MVAAQHDCVLNFCGDIVCIWDTIVYGTERGGEIWYNFSSSGERVTSKKQTVILRAIG